MLTTGDGGMALYPRIKLKKKSKTKKRKDTGIRQTQQPSNKSAGKK